MTLVTPRKAQIRGWTRRRRLSFGIASGFSTMFSWTNADSMRQILAG